MTGDRAVAEHCEALGVVHAARLDEMIEGDSEVRELTSGDGPRALIVTGPPSLTETHDQVEVPLRVRAASAVGLATSGQLFGG